MKIFRPNSWDELFSYPGHTNNIPRNEVVKGRIFGKYDLPHPMHPCGIRECHTDHLHGFVVKLENDSVTHLGQNCGQKHFPEWGRMLSAFTEVEKQAAMKEAIKLVKEKSLEILPWLMSIEADVKLYAKCHQAFEKAIRGPLYDELVRRAEKDKPEINKVFALTKEEKDIAELQGRKVGASEERIVAVISGLGAMKYNARADAIYSQLSRLANRLALTSELIEGDRYRMFLQEAENLQSLEHRLRQSIDRCKAFFTHENLQKILLLPQAKSQAIKSVSMSKDGDISAKRRDGWR